MTLLEKMFGRNQNRVPVAPASQGEAVEPIDDELTRTLKPMYERNHASMEYFPLFVRQMGKVKTYLKQNPADLEKRMYFTHLLTEVGAGPLAIEEAQKVFMGYHLAGEVNAKKDSLLLYSIRRTFKRCGREDLVEQYPLLNDPHITEFEKPVAGCSGYGPLIGATIGHIEFWAAQLDEQKW